MLKKIRVAVASVMFLSAMALFLDFTGTIHAWLGWVAQIQFLPALLAINVVVVAVLVLLTLAIGRVYCSVICPLGILQDILSWFGGKFKKNRFVYTKPKTILRWSVFAVFALLMILGVNGIAILIAPYSAFGRIAQNLFQPLYMGGNLLLNYIAERADSYAFYPAEVWIRSIPTFVIALVSFIGLGILAWRGGRTYCNTICPVGTLLGALARFSWFKPVIDESKCVNCKMCAKRCKCSCIDVENHQIDYSRCVACMNCMGNCKKGAISFCHPKKQTTVKTSENEASTAGAGDAAQDGGNVESVKPDVSTARRGFIGACGAMLISSVAEAADKTTDGGLAELKERRSPDREMPVKPAGSLSFMNMSRRCTGCQLCVAVCPNGVLRPSTSLKNLMQPEMSFERGYCRPECTKCGEVCPAGAITKITREEKTSIQVGHAVWVKSLCLTATDGVSCGACARQCPNGAIRMMAIDPDKEDSLKIPVVNTARCIGCGACEFVCPARPISAIHIEGHEEHQEI